MEGLDATKLEPVLIGPGGAVAALLLFIGYLMKEISNARKERDSYQGKYENMREQRDEFRYLAAEATRTGKRAAATHVALLRRRIERPLDFEEDDEERVS